MELRSLIAKLKKEHAKLAEMIASLEALDKAKRRAGTAERSACTRHLEAGGERARKRGKAGLDNKASPRRQESAIPKSPTQPGLRGA